MEQPHRRSRHRPRRQNLRRRGRHPGHRRRKTGAAAPRRTRRRPQNQTGNPPLAHIATSSAWNPSRRCCCIILSLVVIPCGSAVVVAPALAFAFLLSSRRDLLLSLPLRSDPFNPCQSVLSLPVPSETSAMARTYFAPAFASPRYF